MHQFRLHQSFCAVLMLAFFCSPFVGCGGGGKLPDGMPRPYPTVISVIQDGRPLEGASVVLMSVDSSNSWSAVGTTGSDGKAEIKVQGKYAGAVPGKYHILVTKTETDKSKITVPDANTDPGGYARAVEEVKKEVRNTYDLVELKYGKLSAGPEQIEVTTGKNEKTVDVGAAVHLLRASTGKN